MNPDPMQQLLEHEVRVCWDWPDTFHRGVRLSITAEDGRVLAIFRRDGMEAKVPVGMRRLTTDLIPWEIDGRVSLHQVHGQDGLDAHLIWWLGSAQVLVRREPDVPCFKVTVCLMDKYERHVDLESGDLDLTPEPLRTILLG